MTSTSKLREASAVRPGAAETRVIEANRDFYRRIALKYDRYESGIIDSNLQQDLEADLNRIHSCCKSIGPTLRCLDCGGGTGNLALKMAERGWQVTVVDVSEEMLNLLDEKGRARGCVLELVHSPIERFLEETNQQYDLVAFSSVLHHLYSYARAVGNAASCVRWGGFFYSNYDPVVPKRPRLTRAWDSLDTAVAKVMFDRADILPGIRRRLRKLVAPADPLLGRTVVSAGDIAEFHAKTGVNQGEILRLLRNNGFIVMEHLRYATGRTPVIRFLNERLRLLESFKIIARRDYRPTKAYSQNG